MPMKEDSPRHSGVRIRRGLHWLSISHHFTVRLDGNDGNCRDRHRLVVRSAAQGRCEVVALLTPNCTLAEAW